MLDKIYICSTFYHVLIAILKVMVNQECADIMLLEYIPEAKKFSFRLKERELFGQVYFQPHVNEYINNHVTIFSRLFEHRRNAKLVRKQLVVDLRKYKDIYIFHDDTWLARYLKCEGKRYHLIEDSLDSFVDLKNSNFAHILMFGKSKFKIFVKNIFHLGYVYLDKSKCVKSIEVNDASKIKSMKKIIELPRKQLFEILTSQQKQVILHLFECPVCSLPSSVVLYLTLPLVADGFVESEDDEMIISKQIIKENVSRQEKLVIKPHPRDFADYKKDFPNALILEKNIPIEVYFLNDGFEVKKCITLYSSSVGHLPVLDKIVLLNTHEPWRPQVKAYLQYAKHAF